MAVFEVDRDTMLQIFELKRSLRNSVNGVLSGVLTAAHLTADAIAILEKLDELEVTLLNQRIVQTVPPVSQTSQPIETLAQQVPSSPEIETGGSQQPEAQEVTTTEETSQLQEAGIEVEKASTQVQGGQ